jgi:hypothetical protein
MKKLKCRIRIDKGKTHNYPKERKKRISIRVKCNQREKNPMWKGNKVSNDSARQRAIRWFPAPKGFDHHHIDGNPLNNDPSNIRIQTRKNHMIEDGRLEKLIEMDKKRWVK